MDGTTKRPNGRTFEDALRRVRASVDAGGKLPHRYVTAELLGRGSWLELVVRGSDGKMIARTGWSTEDFSDDTLENIAEWLEVHAARTERRHLRVIG